MKKKIEFKFHPSANCEKMRSTRGKMDKDVDNAPIFIRRARLEIWRVS
jgi:hypothetical protein